MKEILSTETRPLTKVEQVRDIILDLPHWLTTAVGFDSRAAPFGETAFDAYELAGIKLQGYASTDLRDGIELAMATSGTGQRLAAFADIFVVMRIIFDVPYALAQSSVGVRTPYAVFMQPRTGPYRLRWPVITDSQNFVVGIDNYLAEMGGSYGPLQEYDWLSTTFAPRNLPSCVSRCGTFNPAMACQCDTACTYYGDCCVDVDYTCGSQTAMSGGGPQPAAAAGGGGTRRGRVVP